MLVLASSDCPKGDICLSILSIGIGGLKSYSFQENYWVKLKISCSCPRQVDENVPNTSHYWKKTELKSFVNIAKLSTQKAGN